MIGSSPELLVKLEAGRVETHPIAGTRPRGSTPIEDIELEAELLNDEKERAEHVSPIGLWRI
ncbi:chorismate-binding protein [Aeropyrum pernix]|uniref:chorismate-binding protein n=1 Tax=Aeropyrum pernix TaxID=56636 RepID=UPI0027D9651B|nr:chorismate-binding protein [Aeropyrum pernix]